MSEADDVVRAGQTVAARYRLGAELGRGGTGSVWRCIDEQSGQEVAIKIVSGSDASGMPSATKLGRFVREARAIARLRSPHVVRVFDQGRCVAPDGREEIGYLAMELLRGQSLSDRLKREPRLDPKTTLRLLAHVARGVGLAHARGIVHRDLKPGNVFLCDDPLQGWIAKVVDFGMAKSVGIPLATFDLVTTEVGRPLGTPYYMSPEQARGQQNVDHRSDLWSLGVIAFECLCGRRPFEGKSLAKIFADIAVGPIPIPTQVQEGIPRAFDGWFARAVARDVQDRFQSAKVMIEELQEALGEVTTLDRGSVAVTTTFGDAAPTVLRVGAIGGAVGDRTLRRLPVAAGTSFVGRAELVAAIDEALSVHCRVITLAGAEGMGRSRLARDWSERRADRYPGGVWSCDLGDARNESAMWRKLGIAFGARLGPGAERVRLGRVLGALGRCLCLFERADLVREPLARALGGLLQDAPQAVFFVTAKKALEAPTERVVRVDELGFPPPGAGKTWDELKRFPAAELFVKRAIAFDKTLVGRLDAAVAVGNLARRAGGNPLALEVLASLADVESPGNMADALAQALVHEGGTAIIRPDAVLECAARWAIGRLGPFERATLAQLGTFRGGFTAEAAEAVVDLGDASDAPLVTDVLGRLQQRGFLRLVDDEAGQKRFELPHSLVQVCEMLLVDGRGLELDDPGDERTLRARGAAAFERHGRYYAQLGSEEALAALELRGGWLRRARHAADVETLGAASVRAVDRRDGETAAACSLAAAVVELDLGRAAAAAACLVAPAGVAEVPPAWRLRCAIAQGRALAHAGRVDPARHALERATALAGELGDRRGLAAALRGHADYELVTGRPDRAASCAEQARLLARNEGDRIADAEAAHLLGLAALEIGDTARALAVLDEAAQAFGALEARARELATLEARARALGAAGRRNEAFLTLEAALGAARELGDRHVEALLLCDFAELTFQSGDRGRAAALTEQALTRARELGAVELEGRIGLVKAALCAARAAAGDAIAALALGEQVLRAAGPSETLVQLLVRRAFLELGRGQRDAARTTLASAESLLEDLGRLPGSQLKNELHSLRRALG
jgi:serine/threonine-protein kinase